MKVKLQTLFLNSIHQITFQKMSKKKCRYVSIFERKKNLTFCQFLVFVNTTMVKAGPRAHQLTETKNFYTAERNAVLNLPYIHLHLKFEFV